MKRQGFAVLLALVGVVSLAPLARAQAPACDACPGDCASCQMVTQMKTVIEKKYSSKYVEYCRPTCSWFGLCDCGCKKCVKKVLILHFRKHEEPEKKCVLQQDAPACAAPAPGCAAAMPAPTMPPVAMPPGAIPQRMPR